jgi:cytochrome c oxidase cbb3-type subunit 3
VRRHLPALCTTATAVLVLGQVGLGAQATNRSHVDAAAADRGRTVWAAQCIDCHGAQARGTANGPNLVRSLVVLHDRLGTELGPFLKKGHPTQSGTSSASFTDGQVTDLANFLLQRVNDTLRGSPVFKEGDILTGDAKAGAEYFNGAGKCATCHSAARSLAGIATKYDPVTLQQRVLFPESGRGGRGGRGAPNPNPVTVAVTPASGATVSGVLVQMDDFTVSLRDASGTTRTFARSPTLKVVKADPFAEHHALLEVITDKNIHDVVAYLETLK